MSNRLIICKSSNKATTLIVYVDDIVVIDNDEAELKELRVI